MWSTDSAAIEVRETVLVFSTLVERRAFFFCSLSAWGGGLGGLLRFRSAIVLLAWLRLFIFLLPELRCAGGGQFSLFSSATEKDAAAADEGGSLGAAESLSATYSISNRLWLELFDLIYKGGRFAIFENR